MKVAMRTIAHMAINAWTAYRLLHLADTLKQCSSIQQIKSKMAKFMTFEKFVFKLCLYMLDDKPSDMHEEHRPQPCDLGPTRSADDLRQKAKTKKYRHLGYFNEPDGKMLRLSKDCPHEPTVATKSKDDRVHPADSRSRDST